MWERIISSNLRKSMSYGTRSGNEERCFFCVGAIIMFFIGLREFGIRKLLKKVGNLAIIL